MFEAEANAAAWFVDRHAHGARRDHVAFVEAGGEGRRLTYGELGARAARVGGLLARTGVARENRVALLMSDNADLPAVFWGALKAGVVPVPINTMLSGELTRAILADYRRGRCSSRRSCCPPSRPSWAICRNCGRRSWWGRAAISKRR